MCAKAARILDGHRFPDNTAGTITGIGVFPSVVIALVSFSPAAYQAVMAARDAINTGLGLCRTVVVSLRGPHRDLVSCAQRVKSREAAGTSTCRAALS